LLHDGRADESLAACELSPRELQTLLNAAHANHCPVSELLRKAVNGLTYVDCLKAQVEQLHRAVVHATTIIEIYSGLDVVGTADFNFGLGLMADNARDQLKAASGALLTGICAGNEVPA
jgi:hypothetical protein